MSRQFLLPMILTTLLLTGTAAWAQTAARRTVFPLLREGSTADLDLEVQDETAEAWRPGIYKGKVEASFSLGFLNLNSTLLSHEQIIYKYTTDNTYWGDVELKGSTAFAPVLRIGYNPTGWLTVEGNACLSFSEYQATVTNRFVRPNEPEASVSPTEPALGEFDAEKRSLITFLGGGNLLVFPLNFGEPRGGRVHPYLTAGAGRIWYDMNSNYTDGPAGSMDLNFGGGIRLLADSNVSVRIEVAMHRNSVEFTPPTYFQERDEGTLLVPLEEHPIVDDQLLDRQVTSYESHDITSLNWSIGVQGSF